MSGSRPDPYVNLGKFIKRQRELAQLSVRQLADLCGISNPYLSQIERGLRTPSSMILQSLWRLRGHREDTGRPARDRPEASGWAPTGLRSEAAGESRASPVVADDPWL